MYAAKPLIAKTNYKNTDNDTDNALFILNTFKNIQKVTKTYLRNKYVYKNK